ESDRDAVLAFRGTAAPDEWVTDAIARQIPYPYVQGMGRTHEGITELYASMRERILQTVMSLPPDKTLFVTGHSLGGALAAVAAPDLAARRGTSPVVYTFGAPRVGSPLFAWGYGRTVPDSYRLCNPSDAVTHLPTIHYRLPVSQQYSVYW